MLYVLLQCMSETTNKPQTHRYFVELSFDGTNFHGWQVQPNARSVQGELIEKLSLFFREEIYVIGAGRTDTGVHATHMVAHFETTSKIEKTDDAVYKLNRFLSEEIALSKLYEVVPDAHARFSAMERSYLYRINREKNPFAVGQAWNFQRKLDMQLMNQAASMLLEHSDFACFCKADADVNTTLCDVRSAYWEVMGNEWHFHISADRFLRNMVRAIVGTLVEVGEGKLSLRDFEEILNSGERSEAGASAPGHGLYLSKVAYPSGIQIA